MSLHHTSDKECPLCEEKLKQAHEFLVGWFREVKAKYPNVHTSWTYRGPEAQDVAFFDGKSRFRFPDSYHNKEKDGKPCALAMDLFQIDEDGVGRWSKSFFILLNAEVEAQKLPLTWGGKFKSLGDFCHFQINLDALRKKTN